MAYAFSLDETEKFIDYYARTNWWAAVRRFALFGPWPSILWFFFIQPLIVMFPERLLPPMYSEDYIDIGPMMKWWYNLLSIDTMLTIPQLMQSDSLKKRKGLETKLEIFLR